MKINRHGRAKVLTQEEIQSIFNRGLHNDRDTTLFGVCLFSAARIREACTLLTEDIYTPKGQVRPRLIIRKTNTKGKLATRSLPVIEDLRQLLINYYSLAGDIYLFPGRSDGHLCEDSAARILRTACKEVGIIGVSTHSFRRKLETLKAELEQPTIKPAFESRQIATEPQQQTDKLTHNAGEIARFDEVSSFGEIGVIDKLSGIIESLLGKAENQPSVPIADKLLLTIAEAQALTGLSREFLRDAINSGQLKAKQIGKSWRVKRSDLQEYVDKLF